MHLLHVHLNERYKHLQAKSIYIVFKQTALLWILSAPLSQ